MPTPKQFEKMAAEAARRPPSPAPDREDGWWDSVLSDPRAAGSPGIPIQQRRLSEIPRHVLRVEGIRCNRIVEIQTLDAVRFYGPHAIWKEVGQRLLDNTCPHRTGRQEEDGCWPGWDNRYVGNGAE
jgi:hypothetical protein